MTEKQIVQHSADVDRIDVAYVARLARLSLTAEEQTMFQGQLQQILDYVGTMRRLDLKNVEPMFHVHPVQNVFREDSLREGLPVETVMKNAPDSESDQFRVPRILE